MVRIILTCKEHFTLFGTSGISYYFAFIPIVTGGFYFCSYSVFTYCTCMFLFARYFTSGILSLCPFIVSTAFCYCSALFVETCCTYFCMSVVIICSPVPVCVAVCSNGSVIIRMVANTTQVSCITVYCTCGSCNNFSISTCNNLSMPFSSFFTTDTVNYMCSVVVACTGCFIITMSESFFFNISCVITALSLTGCIFIPTVFGTCGFFSLSCLEIVVIGVNSNCKICYFCCAINI